MIDLSFDSEFGFDSNSGSGSGSDFGPQVNVVIEWCCDLMLL
jgi:hypothetical protein